jgi:uncharacterized Tic20 family protein
MTDSQPEQPRPQEEQAPSAAQAQPAAQPQQPPAPPPWPTLGNNWKDAPAHREGSAARPPNWETAPWGKAADQQGVGWEPPPAYQPGPQPPAYYAPSGPLPVPGHYAGHYPGARIPDAQARNWAVGAHLSPLLTGLFLLPFLGPLVIWLGKRNDHPYIAEQAREALNFTLSMSIYAVAGGIASLIISIMTFGFFLIVAAPLLMVLSVLWLVLTIVAAVKAGNGEAYRYPLTMRMVN